MQGHMIRSLLAVVVGWFVAIGPAARGADPADWPTYNHDPAGWRFNPAEKTLGPGNVGRLVEKWRFPAADSKETIGVVHATPTVVAGEVYFGTATFPAFYKLGPDGKQRWVYRNPVRKAVLPPTDGEPITRQAARRGVGRGHLLLGAGRGRRGLLRRHRRLDVLPRRGDGHGALEGRALAPRSSPTPTGTTCSWPRRSWPTAR